MTPVDQVQTLWSVFESDGPLATLDHVADDCEWVPAPDVPRARALHGAREMRGYLEQLELAGVRFEPALHTCEAVGDNVVVGGRLRVVTSSALSDSPLFWVYRVREGRVSRVEAYACRRDALRAAAAAA